MKAKYKINKERGKDEVNRLQGSDKVWLFLKFLDRFCKKVDQARSKLGNEKWEKIGKSLGDAAIKASTVE